MRVQGSNSGKFLSDKEVQDLIARERSLTTDLDITEFIKIFGEQYAKLKKARETGVNVDAYDNALADKFYYFALEKGLKEKFSDTFYEQGCQCLVDRYNRDKVNKSNPLTPKDITFIINTYKECAGKPNCDKLRQSILDSLHRPGTLRAEVMANIKSISKTGKTIQQIREQKINFLINKYNEENKKQPLSAEQTRLIKVAYHYFKEDEDSDKVGEIKQWVNDIETALKIGTYNKIDEAMRARGWCGKKHGDNFQAWNKAHQENCDKILKRKLGENIPELTEKQKDLIIKCAHPSVGHGLSLINDILNKEETPQKKYEYLEGLFTNGYFFDFNQGWQDAKSVVNETTDSILLEFDSLNEGAATLAQSEGLWTPTFTTGYDAKKDSYKRFESKAVNLVSLKQEATFADLQRESGIEGLTAAIQTDIKKAVNPYVVKADTGEDRKAEYHAKKPLEGLLKNCSTLNYEKALKKIATGNLAELARYKRVAILKEGLNSLGEKITPEQHEQLELLAVKWVPRSAKNYDKQCEQMNDMINKILEDGKQGKIKDLPEYYEMLPQEVKEHDKRHGRGPELKRPSSSRGC